MDKGKDEDHDGNVDWKSSIGPLTRLVGSKKVHPKESEMPGKLRVIIPVAISAVGFALILFRLMPLGVPGEFVFPYVKEPSFDPLALAACALPGVGIMAILIMILRRRHPLKKSEIVAILSVLVACSFLLHVTCSVFLSQGGVEGSMAHVMDQNGDGAYMFRAFAIDDTWEYLEALEEELKGAHEQGPFPHLPTHPPGFVLLFCVAKKMVLMDFPGTELLRSAILGDSLTEGKLRMIASAACLAAVGFWICAALLPVPTYLLARSFLERRPALIAAGLTALFPGTYLFNPITDQMLPLVATTVILLGVRAVIEKKRSYALAFGVTLALSINLTMAMVVPLGVVFFFGALHVYSEQQKGDGQALPPLVKIGLRAGTGVAIVVALLYAVFGLNMVQISRLCLENNQKFNLEKARSYLPFLLTSPIETAYSMGLPLFTLLIFGAADRIKAERRIEKRSAFLWAALTTIILLSILGINRGEVCRLWMFLYPCLAIGALLALCPVKLQPDLEEFKTPFGLESSPQTVWIFLFAGQLLMILFLCMWIDPMWRGQ